jgi:hypothetical protein
MVGVCVTVEVDVGGTVAVDVGGTVAIAVGVQVAVAVGTTESGVAVGDGIDTVAVATGETIPGSVPT